MTIPLDDKDLKISQCLRPLIWKTFVTTGTMIFLSVTITGYQIINAQTTISEGQYDCAIVLGAAVIDGQPSPVFAARLDHGVDLYNQGIVRVVIFTGGVGEGDQLSESEIGAIYAQRHGVLPSHSLVETISTTTLENLQSASALMDRHELSSAVIVSDPLHLRRSLSIAQRLEMNAVGSGTPTTRYQSWKTKTPFLVREIYFLLKFRLLGN